MESGTTFNSRWPQGRLDRRVETTFVDGAWAGLAAAAVGFVIHVVAAEGGAVGVTDSADVVVSGLAAAAIGVGLGPIFAWLTAAHGSVDRVMRGDEGAAVSRPEPAPPAPPAGVSSAPPAAPTKARSTVSIVAITGRVSGLPLVVSGLLLGLVLAVIARRFSPVDALPAVLYGAALGLVLRYLRARRFPDEPAAAPGPPATPPSEPPPASRR